MTFYCFCHCLCIVRNPLLPQPNEMPNAGSSVSGNNGNMNLPLRPEGSALRGMDSSSGPPPSMDIFNPNVGFGPMGAQYNNPQSMGGPPMFPHRPPHPHQQGPPFPNPQGNPFWNQPQHLGPGMKGGVGGSRKMLRPPHHMGNNSNNNAPNMPSKRGRHR